MFTHAKKFEAAAEGADSFDALSALLSQSLEPMDVDNFAVIELKSPQGRMFPQEVFAQHDEAWFREYMGHHLGLDDPCWRHAIDTMQPFTWDNLLEVRRDLTRQSLDVFDAAADHGIIFGLVVPLRSIDGRVTLIAFSGRRALDWERQSCLLLMASVLHRCLDKIADYQPRALPFDLSKREWNCMRWVARGKVDGDSAAIQRIAPKTVENNVSNALRKLGVPTRAAAINKIHRMGFGHLLM